LEEGSRWSFRGKGDAPTQADVQAIADKLDELINTLRA
jgi:hypothetical protein